MMLFRYMVKASQSIPVINLRTLILFSVLTLTMVNSNYLIKK